MLSADKRDKLTLEPPRDAKNLATFYRVKELECRRCADATRDPDARQTWIDIANGWSQLAPARRALTDAVEGRSG